MKKVLFSCVILVSVVANAGTNGVTKLHKEKEAMAQKSIISNGFFLNVGLAFPWHL